ncbi:MAG: oleandomycin transport system permease protein [Actinomycetota bacterium]|jgi:ABC-2 type transport system permease protein/oleandomycin transport system permease protein
MTIASTTLDVRPRHKSRLGWAVSDTLAIAGRNLRAMQRVPQVIVFSTIQPVLFVLMFRYVFGGAIRVPGVRYVDYLMPGIFVQTIAFGSINTGIGLAEDLTRGLIERFRSLPMARSAVLAGRTVADLVRSAFVVSLMVVVGFLVGFRVHTSALGLLAAIGLLLLFAFSLSWIFALIGMRATNAEAAQAAAFPILAPLVFASSAFVPLSSQPGWLQTFSAHQPVTITVNAVRALVLGGPTLTPLLQALAWAVALVAIFAPLAVNYYRRTA